MHRFIEAHPALGSDFERTVDRVMRSPPKPDEQAYSTSERTFAKTRRKARRERPLGGCPTRPPIGQPLAGHPGGDFWVENGPVIAMLPAIPN